MNKSLPTNSLLSSVIKLATGNVAAQIIPFIALPFLSRLYTPEDFGHLAFLMAMCTFLSIFVALRFDVALVSISQKSKMADLLIAGRKVALLLTLVIFVFVAIALAMGVIEHVYLWFLPLSAFALALHNLHIGWLNANERYSSISTFLVLRALIWVIMAGIWPFAFPHVEFGIVYAFIASYVIVSCIEYRFISKDVAASSSGKVVIKQLIGNFKDFPKFNLPHALLSNINASAPAYVLQFFGQTQILGQFSQANRLIMTPWHMVSNALYRVLYQHCASQLDRNSPNFSKVRKLWGGYAALAIGVYIFLYLVATPLFSIVLGEQWHAAGLVAQIMMPWFALRTVSGVLAFLPILKQKQNFALIFEVFYTLAMVLALSLGAMLRDGLTALTWFSWVGTFFVSMQLIWFFILLTEKVNSKVAKLAD